MEPNIELSDITCMSELTLDIKDVKGLIPTNKKIAFGNNPKQFSKWYGIYTFLYHKEE